MRAVAFAILFFFANSAFAASPLKLHGEGIISRVGDGSEKTIALTFDACAGKNSLFDTELIAFLIRNEIPATLFINSRWIDTHKKEFLSLAENPLFEIANHGTRHVPLSVSGASVYGIKGTRNASEARAEVMENQKKIESLTGKAPLFFRSGTAHYDQESVRIVEDLGLFVAGFAINGDSGATANAEAVKKNLLSAKGGEIVIAHINKPGSGTAAGVAAAVPILLEQGFKFVKLSEIFFHRRHNFD